MKNKKDESIKLRILFESVRLFSEKGFHGTSMRDIASSAECSLPMLYYYYKSKDELFYEVAYTELIELIQRLNKEMKVAESFKETFLNAMKQRKELSDYDKAVYKLSLKVLLGFDGDSKVRRDLIEWESGRIERTKQILMTYLPKDDNLNIITNVFTRVMENMTEKIILLDEQITDEMITDEIELLMKSFAMNINNVSTSR